MSKALRVAYAYARAIAGKILKTNTRGHLVALFVLLAMAAMAFVSMRPSSANSSSAKSRRASGSSLSNSEAGLFKPNRKSSKGNVRITNNDGPTLTTDKESYLPGETITFTGTNWAPGEAVTIVISTDGSSEGTTLQSTADNSGSFTATTVMPDSQPTGASQSSATKSNPAGDARSTSSSSGTYTATATGATSGATAQAQFGLSLGEEAEVYDPDLPGFMAGKIDKEEYLRLREEHVNKLRGIVPGRPFDPSWRGKAIQEMNQQEGRPENTNSFNSNSSKSATGNLVEWFGPNTPSSGTVWSSIGPSPLPNGQTFNTNNIPVSGRISAIAIHPTNSSIAYVGAAQGGVYRTLDGGATWTPIFDNAQTLAIGSIAIAPSQPSTIYVGTGEENFSCDTFFGVGVYRIDNADGASPTLSGPFNKDGTGTDQMSGRAIGKVIVHPTNPDIIFVATGSGIGGLNCSGIPGVDSTATSLRPRGLWRSSNATSANPTFDRMTVATDNGGNRSVTDLEFEPGNPNILFTTVLGFSTAGSGGVFYSTNPYVASPTFTRTLATSSTSTSERVEISLNKTGSTIFVYAATSQSSGTFKRGTYTAGTPSGLSWTGSIGTAGFCGGQCTYDMPIAVDPTNANIVYLGGPGDSSPAHILTKVTNATGTPTFTASQTGLHADEHAIEIDPSNNNTIWTGNDGGIFKSTDAASSWTSRNTSGFVATQFQSIAVHSTDANFTIGGTQDNGTECQGPCGTFSGNTWNQADYGDGGFALIDQSQSSLTTLNMYHTYYNQTNTLIGYAYVTSTANAKFVSSPTSDSWSFNGTGGVASCTGGGGYACTEAVEFYMPMAVGPGSPNPIYTGTDQLHRAATPGATNTSVSQVFVSGVPISAVGISPQNDQVRIVGLETGRVFRTMTGQTSGWPEVTGTIPQASTNYISRAVIDPNNQNTAYITMSVYFGDSTAHVYKTTNLNAGTPTWTGIGGGQIPDIPINAFAVDPSNSSFLYAGTDIGVYRSTDGGATWSPFSNGLPRVAVFDMAIQNSNRILRIATHGRGMWEISIGATGNLQGTITNANTSSPISGATVTAGANSTTTNGSGFYQFTGIPVGAYSVSASAPGYTTNSVAGVNVTDGGTTTQNIALTPAPTTGCFTDTTQADFQAGVASNVDLTTTPGSVKLATGSGAIDQQNTNVGSTGQAITTTTWEAQTFTPAVTGQLTQIDADLFCSGCSGANPDITVEIRTTSSNVPTNTVLASTTIPGFSSGTAFYSATFSSPASLTSGTKYAIVLRLLTNRATGTYAWLRSNNGQYSGGDYVISTNSGASWTVNAQDFGFKTYMSTGFTASGDLTSSVKDSNPAIGATPNWTTLSWTGTTPASTTLKFQAAGSNNASGPFNFVGPDATSATFFTTSGASLSQFNGNRYLKYKAYLSTSNSANTPTLNDASVCFNDVATQAATSLAVSSATGTYAGTTNLSATLTSSGSPVSGKTISFTLNGNSAGSAVTNASGVATVSNASLTGINAGSYPSGVGGSFAGDGSYASSAGSNSLTVSKATPTITWTNPANIVYGTALSNTQLNATASVPGSFVYTPASGMVLHAGNGQNLHVDFTPTDTTNYNNTSKDVSINVTKATLTITADDKTKTYRATNPPLTYTPTGFVNGDSASVLSGTPSLSTTAVTNSNVGPYPITITTGTLSAADYSFNFVNGTLTVTKATPLINWSNPADITYGTALSGTQLNATATNPNDGSSVAGNFTYNPISGTVLNAGANQILATNFAPTDTANYNTPAQKTVSININKANPTVSATGGTFTYDGSPHAGSGSATGGAGESLTVTLSYSGTGSTTYGPLATAPTNAGTYQVVAHTNGDSNNNSGDSSPAALTINKASSTTTIDCTAGAPFTYTGSAITPCTATATGAGGLNVSVPPVNYTNNVNAGAATASTTYGGDANHDGSTGNGGFTINKASSTTTIDCTAGAPFTYTGSAITPCTATATGAGGLNVSVTPVNYTNNINAGAATASATYGGDANHDGSTGNGGFTINKASSTTTIDCTAGAPFTYTGSAIAPCTATATGAGGLNVSVTPVNYTNNINAGAATASATYGGDANHDGSTGNGGFTINKASSTTTIDCTTGAPFTYTGSAITPCSATATGAGGLNASVTPVNYTNNVNAGAATASATYSGDANHDGSTGNGGFTINKASSTTTLDCTAGSPFTYTGSAITPCTAIATGAGGLNVSVTPVNYTNNVNAGSATASATYGGDANHESSTGNGGFTINKASSTTAATCGAGPFTYNGSAQTPCSASVTGAGGLNQTLTVSYSNNVNAGTATGSASYGGDDNHTGSSDSKNFTIDKASSTTAVTCGAGPFTYNGSAITPCSAAVTGTGALNKALTVGYSNNTNAGTATASASYGGDDNHTGSSDSKNFNIDKAASTTTLTCGAGPFSYDGSAITPCSASVTGAGGLNQALTVGYANNINAGAATASASYGGDDNHTSSSDSKMFTIDKASSTTTVTCSAGPFIYDGAPITPCSAAVTGAGGLNQALTVGYSNNTNAGTATANASFGRDDNHTGSNNSATFEITKASSSVTVNCPASETYTGGAIEPCTASFSGAGGLAGTLTPSYASKINVGTATASASYGGDNNHTGSSDSKNFSITKAGSTTTVVCPASETYTGAAITPCTATATGAGGLNASVTPVNYTNNVNAGSATASATYGGDANHDGSTGNSGFTINKAAAMIVVNGFSGVYDGDPHGVIGSSATGVNSEALTGLSIAPTTYANVPGGLIHWTFTNANYGDQEGDTAVTIGPATSTTTVTCTGSPSYTGSGIMPCSVTVTGVNLSLAPDPEYTNNVDAGDDTASAGYTYAGDPNHTGSHDSKTFSIAKASSTSTVTCDSGPVTYNGIPQEPCTANVTGVGGLGHSLTVNYTDNTNAGTATASASFDGDANHEKSDDSRNFTIGKATATIIVTGFSGDYDGNTHGVVSSSATGVGGVALSGLVVDSTTYTNVPGGLVHWIFTNANYADQSGNATVTITKANQYITFGAIDDKTFGNAAFGINATSNSGLTVSLAVTSGPCTLSSPTSPASVYINGAGTCTIVASQSGNGNYNPATAQSRSFNIAKANQTISFNALADKTFGDSDFSVSATGGGSGNPVTFTGTGNCTVSGNNVHITGAGSCTVIAAQSGNNNYNPAADVSRTFGIAKATSTTIVTCPSSVIYTGSARTPCTASVTGAGGLNQSLTVSYANNVIAGTATASASYGGDGDHNGSGDSKNFSIVAANSITTVVSSKNPSTYGDSVSFTATISPNTATGTVQFKIDGTNVGSPVTVANGSATSGATSSLTAGSHSISAVYSGDSNYTGSTGNLNQIVARPVKITGGGSLSPVIQFGFNVKPVQDDTSAKGFKGHVEFHDLGLSGSTDDLKFKSTSINGEYALDNHHGTFTGAGTLNGVSGYLFTVTIEDNAKQGAGNDKFRIQITNPSNNFNYDSNTRATNPDGAIIAGKIKVHYDKDDFNTSSLEGNGSFLAGSLNFDLDVRTDGAGGLNAGAGVQFTDSTNSYTLTSVSIDTMKVGGTVTVSGPALLNGVQGYKFQTDWDTGKLTLQLRLWDSAGKQIYDSKPNTLTSGSCTFVASN
jgi:MBG domain (YGX type)/Bacterial Ig-like domain (group 3)/Carboxypeptidase regulatory-like domain